jgi:superfamily II DNA helicase RecQ
LTEDGGHLFADRYAVRPKPSSDSELLDEVVAVAAADRRAAGIVYTLSRADAERSAAGLLQRGITAASYHAGVISN